MSQREFEEWHKKRSVDIDLDTPWHRFFLHNIKEIEISDNLTVLEIGCGRGGFAVYFAKHYKSQLKKFIAADFSEHAVDLGNNYAIANNIEGVKFEVQDIQNVTYPDSYFDVIISFETIEHVPKPSKAVKELYRLLKPGGTLILTTPNYLGFFGLYRGYLRLTGRKWSEVGQPINKFVMIPRTLFWLKQAGFYIKHFDSEIISLPWFGKHKVLHLNWEKPRFIFKWFGLQSFFICNKK